MNSRSNMFKLLLIQTRRRIYLYFFIKNIGQSKKKKKKKKKKKNEKVNIEERRTIKCLLMTRPPSFDKTLFVVTDDHIQSNLLQ